jgi:hypothetical protein
MRDWERCIRKEKGKRKHNQGVKQIEGKKESFR